MMQFTEIARAKVREYMEQAHLGAPVLRIEPASGSSPVAPQYDFLLAEEWDREDADTLVDAGEFRVLLAEGSSALLEGSTIDYLEEDGHGGFDVRLASGAVSPPPHTRAAAGAGASTAPGAGGAPAPDFSGEPTAADREMAARVQALLDERINPAIAAHSGRISLAEMREGVAYLEMSGGCHGCGMAKVTMRQGVERMLRDAMPELVGVEDITNHRTGASPYYRAD